MARFRISPIAVVVLTVFLDMVGITLVIPVVAPLFLGADGGIFGSQVPLAYRTFVLGLMLGIAPIVQFFSAPLLGAYADRKGRKPVLLGSVLLTGLGHVLAGIGIVMGQLWMLGLSRVLAGIGAGNLSAANSAMVDMSTPETKVRNFGLIGMGIGLGIILGPFFGGILSDTNQVAWFSYSTPLWVAAVLAVLNAAAIGLFFKETLRQVLHRPMNLATGVKNLVRAFQMPNLRAMYLGSFLLGFGYNFFTQFFSVFLVAKFQLTSSEIGSLFAYIGIWTAITQGFVARLLSQVAPPEKVLRWGPLAAAIVLVLLAGIQHARTVYILLPLVALGYGVSSPNVNALISNLAEKDSQGEALGINQSMAALSSAIPPIVSGVAVGILVSLPLMLAAFFIGCSWLVFVYVYRVHISRRLFHEV